MACYTRHGIKRVFIQFQIVSLLQTLVESFKKVMSHAWGSNEANRLKPETWSLQFRIAKNREGTSFQFSWPSRLSIFSVKEKNDPWKIENYKSFSFRTCTGTNSNAKLVNAVGAVSRNVNRKIIGKKRFDPKFPKSSSDSEPRQSKWSVSTQLGLRGLKTFRIERYIYRC